MRLNLKQHLELHHLGGSMLLPTQGGAWLCLPSFPWINPKIDHPWTYFCLKLVCWNSLTSAIRIKVRCGYVPKGKLGRHFHKTDCYSAGKSGLDNIQSCLVSVFMLGEHFMVHPLLRLSLLRWGFSMQCKLDSNSGSTCFFS